MHLGHLEQLRGAEIQLVRPWFHSGMRVLELGGGNGYQASVMASWGCQVESVDVSEVSPGQAMYFAVQQYNGKQLPFPDHAFDLVFSSNVLEHVPHLSDMLQEILRVTRTGGLGVHILPSASWRFWTSLTFYMHLVRRSVSFLAPTARPASRQDGSPVSPKRGWVALAKRALLDGPHGEFPSPFHELYTFSRHWWVPRFRKGGFEVSQRYGSKIFYTGYAICPGATIEWRRHIARWLGSSTIVYILRKKA